MLTIFVPSNPYPDIATQIALDMMLKRSNIANIHTSKSRMDRGQ